jgi:hypothetical protein
VAARIPSAVGGACRLRWAQPQPLAVTCDDRTVETTTTDGKVAFETEAGKVYCVSG